MKDTELSVGLRKYYGWLIGHINLASRMINRAGEHVSTDFWRADKAAYIACRNEIETQFPFLGNYKIRRRN